MSDLFGSFNALRRTMAQHKMQPPLPDPTADNRMQTIAPNVQDDIEVDVTVRNPDGSRASPIAPIAGPTGSLAGTMRAQATQAAPPAGLVAPGNIDLNNRPVVRNPDGTISTVRSITITDDQGRAILIPTVVGNQVVSPQQAIQHFKATGQHLGVFENEQAADQYAQTLHEQQAEQYRDTPPTTPPAQATPPGPQSSAMPSMFGFRQAMRAPPQPVQTAGNVQVPQDRMMDVEPRLQLYTGGEVSEKIPSNLEQIEASIIQRGREANAKAGEAYKRLEAAKGQADFPEALKAFQAARDEFIQVNKEWNATSAHLKNERNRTAQGAAQTDAQIIQNAIAARQAQPRQPVDDPNATRDLNY